MTQAQRTQLDSIDSAIEAIRQGEFIIVVDDEDRENEGDLIIAAEHITAEQMGFMIRYSGGVVCTPMTQARATELQLPLMVINNQDAYRTAFTVSVDYRHDTTTGISATDRALTARQLANDDAKAHDFLRPGHVFPLIAKPAGVLQRAGHTEATVDFCRLAGLEHVGVISEITHDNGEVMRLPELLKFAKAHNLRIVSTADLIRYRRLNEKLVQRIEESELMTDYGKFQAIRYRSLMDNTEHLALVHGDISQSNASNPTLVRVHDERTVDDMLRLGNSKVLDRALKTIVDNQSGVVVYLRQESALELTPEPYEAPQDTIHDPEKKREWREVGLGSQILVDLGVSDLTALSNSQWSFTGLESFGLTLHGTQSF